MDQNDNKGNAEKFAINGLVNKSANLETQEVTDADLKSINKLTLSPLAAEEVFTFKVTMCDNEIDRDYEYFSLKALKDFKKLFVGKTVIKDHFRRADNQVARIYSTEIVENAGVTKNNEVYTQLVAHCYMVKTTSNEDLIAEIKGGIKKEVSVGCSVLSANCSICGTDNTKTYCPHWGGREYDKEGGKQTCHFKLDGGRDAYELSLVAVPAQVNAGLRKSYAGKTMYEHEQIEEPTEKQNENESADEESPELDLSVKVMEAFLFVQKQEGNNDE